VAEGRFREDLYYRLSVFPIRVPPLRERKEDLPLLTDLIFNKYAAERSPQLKGVSREALQAMARYDWPGNVRELLNRVQRAAIVSEHELISASDLDLADADAPSPRAVLQDARGQVERDVLLRTLKMHGYNVSACARHMQVSRVTVYRLCRKHRLELPPER